MIVSKIQVASSTTDDLYQIELTAIRLNKLRLLLASVGRDAKNVAAVQQDANAMEQHIRAALQANGDL